MPTLVQHKDQIAAIIGADLFAFPDFVTDNLIVHDGKKGFAITHGCLETWKPERLAAAVKEALRAMGDGLDCDKNGVRILPLEEINQQRFQPFDDRATSDVL